MRVKIFHQIIDMRGNQLVATLYKNLVNGFKVKPFQPFGYLQIVVIVIGLVVLIVKMHNA